MSTKMGNNLSRLTPITSVISWVDMKGEHSFSHLDFIPMAQRARLTADFWLEENKIAWEVIQTLWFRVIYTTSFLIKRLTQGLLKTSNNMKNTISHSFGMKPCHFYRQLIKKCSIEDRPSPIFLVRRHHRFNFVFSREMLLTSNLKWPYISVSTIDVVRMIWEFFIYQSTQCPNFLGL